MDKTWGSWRSTVQNSLTTRNNSTRKPLSRRMGLRHGNNGPRTGAAAPGTRRRPCSSRGVNAEPGCESASAQGLLGGVKELPPELLSFKRENSQKDRENKRRADTVQHTHGHV